MYYDHIHLNRVGTYTFGTTLKHYISSVFNTSRRASTVQQGSDSRANFSTREANREESSPTLQLPESQPLLHVSSSMDNEPRCLVLEDQHEHEHSNRTRNRCSRVAKSSTIPNHESQSLLNCLNVTPLDMTCHSNLIPKLDTNFSIITNCKSTFFISKCLDYCAKSHSCTCTSSLSQDLTSSSSSKSQSLPPCSNTKSTVLMPLCVIFCLFVQVPKLQVYQTVQVIYHIFCLFFQVLYLYI